MAFFDLFRKRASGTSPAEDEFVEKRLSPRYRIADPDIATLQIEGEVTPHCIADISYSGLCVETKPETTGLPTKSSGNVINAQSALLHLAGKSCQVQVEPVFEHAGRRGYCFVHQQADSLIFLRGPMEFLRRGSELTPMNPDLLKEKYQNNQWRVMRGDSSTDLRLRVAERSDELAEAILTFLADENYQEVVFLNGHLSARYSQGKRHASTSMQQAFGDDVEILRNALFILLGLDERVRSGGARELTHLCLQSLTQKKVEAK